MAMRTTSKLINNFKGLATDGGALSTGEEFARDIVNVELDEFNRLTSRPGWNRITNTTATITTGGGRGVHSYFQKNVITGALEETLLMVKSELRYITSSNNEIKEVSIYKSVPAEACITAFGTEAYPSAGTADTYENTCFNTLNNNTYLNNGVSEQFKYDTKNLYRSGLPTPGKVSYLSDVAGVGIDVSGDIDYRVQFFYKDANSIEIASDLTPLQSVVTRPATAGAVSGIAVLFQVPNYYQAWQMNYARVTVASGAPTDLFDCSGEWNNGDHAPADAGDYPPSFYVGQIVMTHPRDGGLAEIDTTYVNYYRVKAITALTADTSTIQLENLDGTAASLLLDAGDFISSIGARVYRRAIGGTTYYLAKEIAISPMPYSATTDLLSTSTLADQFSFGDYKTDADLIVSEDWVELDESREPAPICRYSVTWRNQVVLAGDSLNKSTVYYSGYEGPEYFPQGVSTNSFIISQNAGAVITGLAVLGASLFVFTRNSIFKVSGELSEDDFRIDEIPVQGVGCISHHTIKAVNGKLWFLHENGIFSISEDGQVTEESYRIRSRFYETYKNSAVSKFNMQESQAYHQVDRHRYLVFIPHGIASKRDINQLVSVLDTSVIIAIDYVTGFVTQLTGIDCSGGITTFKNVMTWSARDTRSNGYTSSINTFKVPTYAASSNSFADLNLNVPIKIAYATPYLSFGEPSLMKKFLRVKMYAMKDRLRSLSSTIAFTLTVQAYLDYKTVVGGRLVFNMLYDSVKNLVIEENVKKMRLTKGRSISLEFLSGSTVNADSGLLIDGFEIEVATPIMPGIKE